MSYHLTIHVGTFTIYKKLAKTTVAHANFDVFSCIWHIVWALLAPEYLVPKSIQTFKIT